MFFFHFPPKTSQKFNYWSNQKWKAFLIYLQFDCQNLNSIWFQLSEKFENFIIGQINYVLSKFQLKKLIKHFLQNYFGYKLKFEVSLAWINYFIILRYKMFNLIAFCCWLCKDELHNYSYKYCRNRLHRLERGETRWKFRRFGAWTSKSPLIKLQRR